MQVNDIDSRWMQLMSGCLSSRRQDKGEASNVRNTASGTTSVTADGVIRISVSQTIWFLDGFPRLAPSGNSVVTLAGAKSGTLTGLDGVVWGMPPEINQQGLPG